MRSYIVALDGEEFEIVIGEQGQITVNGEAVHADVRELGEGRFSLILDQIPFTFSVTAASGRYGVVSGATKYEVTVENERQRLLKKYGGARTSRSLHQEIRAPMPALIVRIEVSPGASVREGDGLVVLEAMKMENELKALASGRVKEIHVSVGKPVEKGQLLITLE